jgi:hypothetical protein
MAEPLGLSSIEQTFVYEPAVAETIKSKDWVVLFAKVAKVPELSTLTRFETDATFRVVTERFWRFESVVTFRVLVTRLWTFRVVTLAKGDTTEFRFEIEEVFREVVTRLWMLEAAVTFMEEVTTLVVVKAFDT